jgi:epoxyqueuosine reductase QueG
MVTSEDVKERAAELEFDLCGIAPATSHPELTAFRDWLERGYAGEMQTCIAPPTAALTFAP